MHFLAVNEHPRILEEVQLEDKDVQSIVNQLHGSKLKTVTLKLTPQSSVKAIIITGLPTIISEKDLFLILNKSTPSLRRIIVADDPEVCGKTKNLAVAIFEKHENAREAMEILKTTQVMGHNVKTVWKDPNFDVIAELARDTRTIYIKNISYSTSIEDLRSLLGKFGQIHKIKKYATKAYVEFDDIDSAKAAVEAMNDKRVAGLCWKIFPSKKLDEEKARESPDKNMVFSKNFLDDEDSEVLNKFVFYGQLPEINQKSLQTAQSIIEHYRNIQKQQVEAQKMQFENIKSIQQLAGANQAQQGGKKGKGKGKGGDGNPQFAAAMMGNPMFGGAFGFPTPVGGNPGGMMMNPAAGGMVPGGTMTPAMGTPGAANLMMGGNQFGFFPVPSTTK